ncbi:MAG: M23 family metallopeptidase, partial [Lachnospiraceae bacterium]|nr:M23 family metallopeptidase [Lachnospiraceae bacterium]
EEDIPAISTSMQSALTFTDSDNLVWPIVGNVLINYSMDKTVYFPTLEQYKYNPAIIIQADEGEIITAAAGGKVTRVFEDREIGNAVTMELGDGYELTYGQLGNILVSEGSFVAAGDVVAEVAAPTKYYSVEGTNVYFKLTKDGDPVNPMTKLE